MPLTDIAIRNAKPADKPRKLFDEKGLFLLLTPKGEKWWRFKYRFDGKEKLLSFGVYPAVGLKDAREKRDKAREALAKGIDPGEQRKAEKAAAGGAGSFEAIAREWWEHRHDEWTPAHATRVLDGLAKDVFPYIGAKPIRAIGAQTMLEVIRRVEERGAVETGHRLRQICDVVFGYAIATGRCDDNPAAAIKVALKSVTGRQHFARLKDPADIGELLRRIEGYTGTHVVRCALKLMPLTFTRPNELCQAKWENIDMEQALWTVPAEVKKQTTANKRNADNTHLVPLSKQAVAILQDLQPLTGAGAFVFPGDRDAKKPLTTAALLNALRRMGYTQGTMTVHGFRGVASTLLREVGKGCFRHEVIEAQLGHRVKNEVEAAYNHAEYLEERAAMMAWWADYLDSLKTGA